MMVVPPWVLLLVVIVVAAGLIYQLKTCTKIGIQYLENFNKLFSTSPKILRYNY